ncbi:MAG: hypothetical protein Roseis2KO_34020 [Roseivirga sp.]
MAQVSTEGTDFWVGFLQNADGNQSSSLEIFITSRQSASGTIVVLQDGRTVNFNVSPGATFKYIVSDATDNPFAASGSGAISTKGIHITSDVDVSVYAFNKRSFSADATVILPTPTLGREYIVASYFENSSQNNIESEFLVVGTENNTSIEITPSVSTIDGKTAGVPFTVTLNQGQAIQLQALGDLTGSEVKSVSADPTECKNFAVFGGNKWTRIGNCGQANDQLYEQLFPVNTWGKNFTLVPFLGRNSNGDLYRIIASENNTSVTVSAGGAPPNSFQLTSRGDYFTGNVSDATSITADKPIQLVQFSKSQCAEIGANNNSIGDPFMLMISPDEQLLNEVTFNTLDSDVIDNYYTTIITKTSSRTEVTLNGTAISNFSWSTVSANTELSYARINLTRDTDYTVVAPEGFISYVYGFGVIESFGYAAGASLETLNLQVVGVDETIGLIVNEGCLNSKTTFSADFETPAGQEPRFNAFEWDFGDGNTSDEQNPVHTYSSPGTYEVFLIASNGTGACGTSQTVNRTVVITEAAIDEFTGPVSVCPDVNGVVYSVTGAADNTYQWSVTGGVIASGGDGSEITIDWGAATDNASVTVTPVNYLGCIGESMTLDVKINKRLEPALPTGPAEVCFADFTAVAYSTPATTGSEYEWFVEGGSFVSGNSSNEVTVAWDGVGIPGRLWYREFNPAISDCEGFSDVVEITVYPDMQISPSAVDVLCFGDANGTVDFAVTGGKPGGYTLRFQGNDLPTTAISGLIAGNYTATVVDVLGCTKDVDFTVGTPEVLAISDMTVLDVRCFQESNGSISVSLSGGTPTAAGAYQFALSGNGRSDTGASSLPTVDNLEAGSYTITISDENGCETSTDFVINEPALLEPDLETLINQPICPDASDGTAYVEAKGGTPDYQFFWSNNDTVDQQEGMNFSRGSYTVRIVDANGCETSLEVEVIERFPKIFIPTAFSPNGDGENDLFRPVTDCNLQYSVQVFNKWGGIVYASSDITEGWDGTLNGQSAPDGKYSYIIFYAGSLNGVSFEETLRGTLRLIR